VIADIGKIAFMPESAEKSKRKDLPLISTDDPDLENARSFTAETRRKSPGSSLVKSFRSSS
jgi:isocitrate lyase